ncbi:MAG: membrane protein insertion efficiency factor YidD [Micavibrio sp.]
MKGVSPVLKKGLIGLIKLYAWLISPFFGPKCRFHPTCSAYGCEAIEKHGAAAGLWLTIRRVFACHPWSGRQGYDPVPEGFEWSAQFRYKRGVPKKLNLQKRKDEI